MLYIIWMLHLENPKDKTLLTSGVGVMGDTALPNVVLKKLNVMHVVKLVIYPERVEARGSGSKRKPIKESNKVKGNPPITSLNTAKTVKTALKEREYPINLLNVCFRSEEHHPI